jgi:hypothetical protein
MVGKGLPTYQAGAWERDKHLMVGKGLPTYQAIKRIVQHRWRGTHGIPTLARGNEIKSIIPFALVLTNYFNSIIRITNQGYSSCKHLLANASAW